MDSQIIRVSKREATIRYRQEARDHRRTNETFRELGILIPEVEASNNAAAVYAEEMAARCEQTPDDTVEIETDGIYLMDVVRLRETTADSMRPR